MPGTASTISCSPGVRGCSTSSWTPCRRWTNWPGSRSSATAGSRRNDGRHGRNTCTTGRGISAWTGEPMDLIVLGAAVDPDPARWQRLAGDRLIVHIGPTAELPAVVTAIEAARARHADVRLAVVVAGPEPAVAAR